MRFEMTGCIRSACLTLRRLERPTVFTALSAPSLHASSAQEKTSSRLEEEEEVEEQQQQQQRHRLEQWRSFFTGVVLVVNFKSVERAWKELDFLRLIYSRVFDTVVAVAPEEIRELSVVGVSHTHTHTSVCTHVRTPRPPHTHTQCDGASLFARCPSEIITALSMSSFHFVLCKNIFCSGDESHVRCIWWG